MITIHTLASGSEGNAALVCGGGVRILVDAGISARRMETALKALGHPPDTLTAVFITHTHSDHTAGLRVFLKHTALPEYQPPARVSHRVLPFCFRLEVTSYAWYCTRLR